MKYRQIEESVFGERPHSYLSFFMFFLSFNNPSFDFIGFYWYILAVMYFLLVKMQSEFQEAAFVKRVFSSLLSREAVSRPYFFFRIVFG